MTRILFALVCLFFIPTQAAAKTYYKQVVDRRVYGPEEPKYCTAPTDDFVCGEDEHDCMGCGTKSDPCIVTVWEIGYEPVKALYSEQCYGQSWAFRELLLHRLAEPAMRCVTARTQELDAFARWAASATKANDSFHRCMLRIEREATESGVSVSDLIHHCNLEIEDAPLVRTCESAQDTDFRRCALSKVEEVEQEWEALEHKLMDESHKRDHNDTWKLYNKNIQGLFERTAYQRIKDNCPNPPFELPLLRQPIPRD